jgi:hypothetical protein
VSCLLSGKWSNCCTHLFIYCTAATGHTCPLHEPWHCCMRVVGSRRHGVPDSRTINTRRCLLPAVLTMAISSLSMYVAATSCLVAAYVHPLCVCAHVQTELEMARKAHQAALEAAGAAEQRAQATEVSKCLLTAHTKSCARSCLPCPCLLAAEAAQALR